MASNDPDIYQKSKNIMKTIGIWFLFGITVFLLTIYVSLYIYYDWRMVVFGSIVVLFGILKAIKSIKEWLNEKSDRELGLGADNPPPKMAQNAPLAPLPPEVGEDGLHKDIKETILSFLDLYGEINYKDDNVLKRIIESMIFREVKRGELTHALHTLVRNNEVHVVKNKILPKAKETSKEIIGKDIPWKVWNICLLVIRNHGFEDFKKIATEIFQTFPVNEWENIIKDLEKGSSMNEIGYTIHLKSIKPKKQEKSPSRIIQVKNPDIPPPHKKNLKIEKIKLKTQKIDEEFSKKIKELGIEVEEPTPEPTFE